MVILLLLANKGKRDVNQSKFGSFVSRVAKNNGESNGDRHKIYNIFLTVLFSS